MSAAAAILGILLNIVKLRTSAISWGQEPSGYQKTDYPLVIHDRDWQPSEVPIEYATPENGYQSFRYLGVQMDNNNQSKKKVNMLRDHLTMRASIARRIPVVAQGVAEIRYPVKWLVQNISQTSTISSQYYSLYGKGIWRNGDYETI